MRALVFVAFLPLLSSCLSQSSLDGFALNREASRGEAVFFVEHQPADTRNLHEVVAQLLVQRGLEAVTTEPAEYDYRVTYVDRWYWDMRMYLIDFRIDIRDADSGVLLATARSYQTSLAALGQRREHIIEKAIIVLLEGPGAIPTPQPRRGRRSTRR